MAEDQRPGARSVPSHRARCPHLRDAAAHASEPVMAKRNGNKEMKKPKQDKAKAKVAGSVSELSAAAAKPAGRKR
jgi:hypothetical protein